MTRWRVALLCAIFGLGAARCLVLTRDGMAASPDSGAYLAAAQGLCQDFSYVGIDGRPIAHWPPLYPATLAVAHCAGASLLGAARLLNATFLGLLALTAWAWVHRSTASAPLATLAALACIVAAPLGLVSRYVWTELLFTVLACGALFCLSKSDDRRSEALAAILIAAAILTRAAGLPLVIVLGTAILTSGQLSGARRLVRAIILCGLASLPLALFTARNLALGLPPLGVRGPSGMTLRSTLYSAIETVGRWFIPGTVANEAPALLLIAIAAGIATVWCLWRESQGVNRRAGIIAFASVICYSTFVAVATVTSGSDRPNPRIMAPIYVPVVVWLTTAGAALARRMAGGRLRAATMAALAVLLFAMHSGPPDMGNFNDSNWRDSHTAAWAAEHLPNEMLFCTRPVVLFLRGRRSFDWPRKHFYQMPTVPVDDLAFLDASLEAGRTPYLVRFVRALPQEAMTVTELEAKYELKPVYSSADGSVHAVLRKR